MRRLHVIFLGSVGLTTLVLFVGQGCQDATQVTLDIAVRAECTDVRETTITVGVDPRETEARLASNFVTATTASCAPQTRGDGAREIGTLVVTPRESGSGSASVIVTIPFGPGAAATACRPPAYERCIVARRHFAFVEYGQLRMPITLDPDCAGVPCDAVSTCRKGKCFSSDTTCDGTTCFEPGDLSKRPPGSDAGEVDAFFPGDGSLVDDGGGAGDGSASDGSTSDGSTSDGSTSDAPADAPSDGPKEGGGGTGVTCQGGTGGVLMCPAFKGGAPMACVDGMSVSCCEGGDKLPYCSATSVCPIGELRYCCAQLNCGMSGLCSPQPFDKAGTCNGPAIP